MNLWKKEYKKADLKDDSDGKALYGNLLNELRSMRKDREDLVEQVVRHIMYYEKPAVEELTAYLRTKIE